MLDRRTLRDHRRGAGRPRAPGLRLVPGAALARRLRAGRRVHWPGSERRRAGGAPSHDHRRGGADVRRSWVMGVAVVAVLVGVVALAVVRGRPQPGEPDPPVYMQPVPSTAADSVLPPSLRSSL